MRAHKHFWCIFDVSLKNGNSIITICDYIKAICDYHKTLKIRKALCSKELAQQAWAA